MTLFPNKITFWGTRDFNISVYGGTQFSLKHHSWRKRTKRKICSSRHHDILQSYSNQDTAVLAHGQKNRWIGELRNSIETDLCYIWFITEIALQNSKNGMDFQKKALGQWEKFYWTPLS